MTDLLRSGATWLANQLKTHCSQEVTLSRGSQTSDPVSATIGQTEHEIEDNVSNMITRIKTRDFLIDAADYTPTGSATLPERGDKIRETQGGTTYVYEVVEPSRGIPHYRFSDDHRTKLRIHTQQIDTE